jgi:hypothetical protein
MKIRFIQIRKKQNNKIFYMIFFFFFSFFSFFRLVLKYNTIVFILLANIISLLNSADIYLISI